MLRRSVASLSKAAIDWSALSAHVPESQRGAYAAFKQKYDSYRQEMASTPLEPTNLDFARYRQTLGAHASIVGDVEKIYKSLDVTARPPLADQLKKVQADPKISADDKKQFAVIVENFNNYTKELAEMKKDEVARSEVFLKELAKEQAELEQAHKDILARKGVDEMSLKELEKEFPKFAAEAEQELKEKNYGAII